MNINRKVLIGAGIAAGVLAIIVLIVVLTKDETVVFQKNTIENEQVWIEFKEKAANKKKCKCVEETIWTLKERGKDKLGRDIFENYITGKYDKDYKPDENEIKEEDTDAPYYYRLYDKMEFYTGDNIYSYNIRIGNRINKVPFLRTNFTTTVDITHVDIEERPLIRYDYYNGVSFQPSVNEDVYIERGVTQAFEKHIKFSEIKTFEDLENYANGGFFVISKENIDLG